MKLVIRNYIAWARNSVVPFFHTTRTYFDLSHALREIHVSSRHASSVAEPATTAASICVFLAHVLEELPANLMVDPHSAAGRLASRP